MIVPPLIRLAGMPSVVLRELRFHEVGRAVEDRLALRRWVEAEGGALSDELYKVIASMAEEPAKPLLVGLRRAFYQVRKPTAREWNPATRELLGRDLADRVHRWLAACDQWRGGGHKLEELIRSETAVRESRLRELASAPAFRRALLQASSALSADLEKWLADPSRDTRRLAPALAKYLSRATAKTSPFSTFMVAGLGTWTDDGAAVRQCAGGLRSARGVLELGHGARSDLHAALVASERVRRGMIVRVNPSVVAAGDRLRFLGHPPQEPMITTDGTPAIRACLKLIHDEGVITFGDLAGKLAATGNAQPAQVNAFLEHLVEIGLLQIVPQPDGQITTPGEVGHWLRSLGEEFAEESSLLQAVSEAVRSAVPIEDVERHQGRLSTARRALASLSVHLGQPIALNGSLTFDVAVTARPLAECSRRAWRPVLADLQVIRRWLALFSAGQDLKIALDTWWGQRPGAHRRIPFLDFYHEVMKEVAGGSLAGKEIGRLWHSARSRRASAFGRIHELHALRDAAAGVLWRDADPDGVVSIDARELTDAVAGFPPWLDDLHSVAVYGQPLMDEAGPVFVVNNVFTGYGKGHSRLDHLVGDRTEPWAQPSGDYPVFAALGGSLGTSLNVREPCAPYEIAYPWHGDVRPGVRRIDLRDLWVERDHARELLRLRSGSLDRQIWPLHLGMSAPWTLPRAAQLLVRAFGEEPPLPIMSIAPRGHWTALPEVSVIPRARVGRVVVRRASRKMAPANVPARRAGERMAEYIVRLAAWRKGSGIPERCFVKGLARKRSFARSSEHKPLYMDFANPFLLQAFTEFLRQPHDAVVFEEALPDPMSAHENYGGAHVMEMVIDVAAWSA
ncbi:lantibiotic biosynthesis dehydratase-like protein [Nonomuraea polychroma]|uniref:Lantibiotic biosynthesis dehydratase-like protein n=1 Tax=Nonomuraea polychroma TaxID=46176 RepID=A0A438MGV0_9ACTN|nr:lantibiotic dehydratase [Nonomuraea polychroma]RVX44994.1 lantibiotic biosynthesis dehydratase-like protein [Nonomuraea polychroma]